MLITASTAAPLASVHVKFISPPHIYEHQLTTDGNKSMEKLIILTHYSFIAANKIIHYVNF